MPTITVSKKELEKLLGKKIELAKLQEIMLTYLKSDLNAKDDELSVEIADTNRPDLLSAEGIARELRTILGIKQIKYQIKESDVAVKVDKKIRKIRPYIACSVVKEVKLTDKLIKSLMQLQEKLDSGYGRKRRKMSIGLYNFDRIKPPVLYTTVNPKQIKFIPLGFEKEMTPEQILKEHPKGIEYADILKGEKEYPLLIDSVSNVLSLPPIINSNSLGKVDETTKNLFVEVTGTDYETVLNTLNIISTALAEHGGKISSVKIDYKYVELGKEKTPRLEGEHFEIEPTYIQEVLGLSIDIRQIKHLLQKMNYQVIRADSLNDIIVVEVPFYRKDIMHAVDIVEDIAIAYDYNQIEPVMPELPTVGKLLSETQKQDNIRELMVGMGLQEIFSFTLTNKEMLFQKMNSSEKPVIEIANPVSSTYSCLRNSLLPVLMDFLEINKTVEFPQRIFELGDVIIPDPKAENCARQFPMLTSVISHSTAGFTEIKSVLDALLKNLGKEYEIKPAKHPFFIEGRCGEILIKGKPVGIIGEIHPQVLENFNLENPVAGFEINVEEL